jgi:hypothetical protein
MWIIYNAQTGMEYNSYEHYAEAVAERDGLNRASEFGDVFNMRYEER